MEERLKEILAPEEKVLWQGRTAPEKLMQAPDRPKQIRLWVIFAAFVGLTLFVLFPYLIYLQRPWDVLLVSFLVVNAVPLALAMRPWMDRNDLEKRSIYAVTDSRVIALVKDNVYSLPVDDLDWAVANRDGKAGCLRLGACVTKAKHDDRVEAVMSYTDDDTGAVGMVFYHIDNVDTVADTLATCANKLKQVG